MKGDVVVGLFGLGIGLIGIALMVYAVRDAAGLTRRPRKNREAPAARVSGLASSQEMGNTGEGIPVLTWFVSNQRDSYIRRRFPSYVSAFGALLLAVGGGVDITGFLGSRSTPGVDVARLLGWIAVGGGVVGAVWSFTPYLSARQAYRQWRLALAAARVDAALAKACEGVPHGKALQLPDLFQLNRRQLDEYQLITRKQQKSAFLWAQVAIGVAFAVLVGGILVAVSGSSNVEKYIAGGLSGLGSLLSTFVATTFFRSASEANRQMNRYYLEPQRTGRLLASERLIDTVQSWPEDRETLLSTIVTTVMGWEMPPDVDGSPPQNGAGPKTKAKVGPVPRQRAGAGA